MQALMHYFCAADTIAERERKDPKRVMPGPSGLEELYLSDMPCVWEATPEAHTRSLRKLHLDSDSYLTASQLAAMTALQSLHASTQAVYAAVTEALPALVLLTRLELPASRDRRFQSGRFSGDAAGTAQLAVMLRQLSALPSLQHLTVGGPACKGAQMLDGAAVLPRTLEVLYLDYPNEIVANNGFLAFLHQPGRLSAVRIGQLALGPEYKSSSDFPMAMMLRMPAHVRVTVCTFVGRHYRLW